MTSIFFRKTVKTCLLVSSLLLIPTSIVTAEENASKDKDGKPLITTVVLKGKNKVSNFDYQTRRGPKSYYAGIGIGASYLDPATPGAPSVEEHWAGAGQLLLGIDFNSRLSGEIHTADLGSAGFAPTGGLNYNVHAISGLVYFSRRGLPLYKTRLNGFARLGIGHFDLTTDGDIDVGVQDENHTVFGAGLELKMKSSLNARLELISYSEDARYAQMALLYRFGQKESHKVPIQIATAPVTIINAISAMKSGQNIDGGGDRDQDQVPDNRDLCPDTEPGLTVDPEGCAIFAGVVQDVNFNTDSHVLTVNARRVLTEVSNTLKQYPKTTIRVVAHTDSHGSAAYNQQLSERRAASVVGFLVSNNIERSRLVPAAFGETKPVTTNASATGRARNRRVELFAHGR